MGFPDELGLAMRTSSVEGEEWSSSSSSWLKSTMTSWIVAEGSLQDSISFETSSTSADDAVLGGVVLRRPLMKPSEDPLPCEITVYFQEKHEIHRIYVRSTARVYELYYALNCQDDSNEYLCTVRCGPVGRETTEKSDSAACQMGDFECTALPEQMVRHDNNNNNEDGWVEVKAPDSLFHEDKKLSVDNKSNRSTIKVMQEHYEATAEISDASPCVSLTLRLLSLDMKESVHIEEIYIYADTVLAINPDPRTIAMGDLGGSSLLAMLVPGLLQKSESGCSKIQDRRTSTNSGIQKYLDHAKNKAGSTSLNMEGMVPKSNHSHAGKESTELKCAHTHSGSTCEITDSDQKTKPVPKEDKLVPGHMEKVLDELVSRVGRIETFCMRFEENLMKPLSGIEMRLQQLERQLEALTMRNQFSQPFPGSKISAPEVLIDRSDLESLDCFTSQAFHSDSVIHERSSVRDDAAISMPASEKMSPYLIVKAPEFSNEENELNNSQLVNELPKTKTSLSIDDALSSALAAFVISTRVASPGQKPKHNQDNEFSDGNENVLASAAAKGFSEGESVRGMANTSDGYKESAVFDDMLISAEEVLCPVFDSQMGPGLSISAPEFLSEEDDSTNQDQTSDPWVRERMNNSAFAEFLSASMVASQFPNDYSNGLDSSSGPDCYENVKNLGTGDQENDVNLNAASDSNSDFLLGKGAMAQTTCDKVSHLYCIGGTGEGSAPSSVHPGDRVSKEKQSFVGQECSSVHETEGIPPFDCCVGVESTEARLLYDGLTGDGDAEKAAVGGLHMDNYGKGWIKDNSTHSSTYGTLMDEKAEIKWSDKSSTSSVNQYNEQAVDSDWSTLATVASSNNHSNGDQSSAGYTNETSKAELKGDLSNLLDFEHPLLDVDFSPEQDETNEASLFGEMSSLEGQVYGRKDDENDYLLDMMYFNSSPSTDLGQHALEEHQFIGRTCIVTGFSLSENLEDWTLPTADSSSVGDMPTGQGISNYQVLSSLI